MCVWCGPICYGGAAHNARVEDGVFYRWNDWKPRIYKAGQLWAVHRDVTFYVASWDDALRIALAVVNATIKAGSYEC